MRVTSFEVVPANPANKIVLGTKPALGDEHRKFQVRQIDGLDADEIMRQYLGRGAGSGRKFYNLSLPEREIVVTMVLDPRFDLGDSYSDLRDELYRLVSSSRTGEIEVHFLNGEEVVATLIGSPSKVEAALWEQVQAMSVTINCPYPLLASPERVELSPGPGDLVTITDEKSTAHHGLVANLKFTEGPEYFEIGDPEGEWYFRVTPAGGFYDDDELILSSEYNQRKIYLGRGEDLIGLADVVKSGSMWPFVFPGENQFQLSTDAVEWLYLGHYSTYWGG